MTRLAVLGMTLTAALLGGCAGPALAPINLAEPGWNVRESQVVWRPRESSPELVGELLVATHPDGRLFVQFSKQTLPIIIAQAATNGWSLESPLRRGRFGGSGEPTDRVPWFLLGNLPPQPNRGSRWRVDQPSDGAWRLRNPKTGEFVEGSTPHAM